MVRFNLFALILIINLFASGQTTSGVKSGDQSKPQSADNTVVPVTYSRQFNQMNYKMEDCLNKGKYDICIKLKKQKKDENRPQDQLAASLKACELKPHEACGGIFSLARQIGGSSLTATQKVLEGVCLKNAEACDEVSNFYEEMKDYNSAISFARKYYLKFQKGSFARMSYTYGDKNEAFAASRVACESDYKTCAEYLKLMPDHPEITKLVKGSEKACLNAARGVVSDEACSAVGLHYYNLGNNNKAYEAWSKECDLYNPAGCFYVIGGSFDEMRKQFAAAKFCRIPIKNLNANQANIQKINCNSKSNKVTDQLKAVGEYELKIITAPKKN